MRIIYIYSGLILVLLSCASNESTKNEAYSNSTIDEFQKIESSNYLSGKKTTPNESIDKKSSTPLSKQKNISISIKTDLPGNEERIAELNQNLAIYCMKKSRVRNFKNEKHCLDFVQESLNKCEENQNKATHGLISCVKKKLGLK